MSCKRCVYCQKCKERPENGGRCSDFKDRELFIELPFHVNQIIFFLRNETKKVAVVIDGEPYFKLVTKTKIDTTVFSGDILSNYISATRSEQAKIEKRYYPTRADAEKALAERKRNK